MIKFKQVISLFSLWG